MLGWVTVVVTWALVSEISTVSVSPGWKWGEFLSPPVRFTSTRPALVTGSVHAVATRSLVAVAMVSPSTETTSAKAAPPANRVMAAVATAATARHTGLMNTVRHRCWTGVVWCTVAASDLRKQDPPPILDGGLTRCRPNGRRDLSVMPWMPAFETFCIWSAVGQASTATCVLASVAVAVAVPRRSKKCPPSAGCFHLRRACPAGGVSAAAGSLTRCGTPLANKERVTPWHREPLSGSTLRRALASSPRTAAARTCSSTTPLSTPRATARWTRLSAWSSRSPRVRRARRLTPFARSDRGLPNQTVFTEAPAGTVPAGASAWMPVVRPCGASACGGELGEEVLCHRGRHLPTTLALFDEDGERHVALVADEPGVSLGRVLRAMLGRPGLAVHRATRGVCHDRRRAVDHDLAPAVLQLADGLAVQRCWLAAGARGSRVGDQGRRDHRAAGHRAGHDPGRHRGDDVAALSDRGRRLVGLAVVDRHAAVERAVDTETLCPAGADAKLFRRGGEVAVAELGCQLDEGRVARVGEGRRQ